MIIGGITGLLMKTDPLEIGLGFLIVILISALCAPYCVYDARKWQTKRRISIGVAGLLVAAGLRVVMHHFV